MYGILSLDLRWVQRRTDPVPVPQILCLPRRVTRPGHKDPYKSSAPGRVSESRPLNRRKTVTGSQTTKTTDKYIGQHYFEMGASISPQSTILP